MEAIAKVRAEIERLIELNKTKNGFPASFPCEFRIEAYEVLLSVIDTLEEPVCEKLDEAAMNYIAPIENEDGLNVINFSGQDIKEAFIAGAKWQKEQFEKNCNDACDRMTKEEYDLETDFALGIFNKENRMPTFIDAINYGMQLQKEQMMKEDEK